jgi:hypothetical protein
MPMPTKRLTVRIPTELDALLGRIQAKRARQFLRQPRKVDLLVEAALLLAQKEGFEVSGIGESVPPPRRPARAAGKGRKVAAA